MTSILPFLTHTPIIHPDTFLASNAVIIGDVKIGKDSSIWYNCVLRGDVNHIEIGERTNIQDGTVIHTADNGPATLIGNDITVGHMALLHACTLEDGCFVGMKACVMDGAVIESGAMVAAGAVVPPGKRVPAGEIWSGTPARFLRPLTPKDITFIKGNVGHYVDLWKQYTER